MLARSSCNTIAAGSRQQQHEQQQQQHVVRVWVSLLVLCFCHSDQGECLRFFTTLQMSSILYMPTCNHAIYVHNCIQMHFLVVDLSVLALCLHSHEGIGTIQAMLFRLCMENTSKFQYRIIQDNNGRMLCASAPKNLL